jgi:hypothetical protein
MFLLYIVISMHIDQWNTVRLIIFCRTTRILGYFEETPSVCTHFRLFIAVIWHIPSCCIFVILISLYTTPQFNYLDVNLFWNKNKHYILYLIESYFYSENHGTRNLLFSLLCWLVICKTDSAMYWFSCSWVRLNQRQYN